MSFRSLPLTLRALQRTQPGHQRLERKESQILTATVLHDYRPNGKRQDVYGCEWETSFHTFVVGFYRKFWNL